MPARRLRPSALDAPALAALLRDQEGVVSRGQVLRLGGTQADIRSRLRRREWVQLHPGVYVDHTGRPSWHQRCWGAVLHYWPAALHRESALRAYGLTRDRALRAVDEPIHLMVDARRRVRPVPGIRLERVHDSGRWTRDNHGPPRVRLEFALLKVAADQDPAGAVAVLSDAVQQRRTTAARLVSTLESLPRLPHRAAMLEILRDVASGARSVLERRYLVDVERAHGLPTGRRQRRRSGAAGVSYQDVEYAEQRTVVELDGAFGHRDAQDRWHDLARDLVAVLDGELTLRPGWGQVLEPCRLAALVGEVLVARGWAGRLAPCGPGCTAVRGASGPSEGTDAPRSA